MTTAPLFSIIVPTYNRASLIGATLKTLLAQNTKLLYEIIIVDDGSTDNTEAVVAPYLSDQVHYYKNENAERAAARNYGAAKAKGQWLNFFDSDDWALENHISEAAQLIETHQTLEWFHLAYAWADKKGQAFKKVNHFEGVTLNALMHKGNPLSCNGVFINRAIFLKHQFIEDRALSASEDYELWCRLAARYPLYYSNNISSYVIDHEERSVRTINGEKLIQRLELFLHYVQQDATNRTYYKEKINDIKMDAYSYIALHLVNVPKYKLKAIKYLVKAFSSQWRVITTKRFFAIIKNEIIKW